MVDELRWEAGPLPGLVLAYDGDDVQVGRARVQRTSPNAWEAHYDMRGLERPAFGLGGPAIDDSRYLVASGVSLHEARRAVERCHEARRRR